MRKCLKCGEAFDAPCDRTFCPDCWRKENPWVPGSLRDAFSPKPSGYADEYKGFEAGRPIDNVEIELKERLEHCLGGKEEAKSPPSTMTAKLKTKRRPVVEEDRAQKALEAALK